MTEIIIFIVIIVAVVVKIVMSSCLSSNKDTTQPTKKKPENKKVKPNVPEPEFRRAKPNEPRGDVKKVKPNVPKSDNKTIKPNVPKKERKPLEKRSSVIKAKLVSGGAAAKTYAQKSETDILTAAKENTREVEIENDKDAVAAENLMENIYDLIAKGPDDTLVFQRDFVAEGMEMLNHITIPDVWEAE